MTKIKLKLGDNYQDVELQDDYLFNSYLIMHPELIKKLIHNIAFRYKINRTYFRIVNSFIDYNKCSNLSYPGLIVRVGIYRYAVLYLENCQIDEEYMVSLIKEYIYDVGERIPEEIFIDQFEIDKFSFLKVFKN